MRVRLKCVRRLQKSTSVEGTQSTSVEGTQSIDELMGGLRAKQVCVWLLFDAARNTPSFFAGAVPTAGDLTFQDDAMFLHDVIKSAHRAGRVVSFYGADGAAAHASLTRGIQRALANGERTEGQVEHVARELLPELQRLFSVIHGLLRLAIDHTDGPLHWSAAQWRIPYRGLPYAMLRCQITGSLIGVSHEWRHTCRLMVRIRTTPHCGFSGQELIQNAANRTCVQAKHLRDKQDKLIHTVMLLHALHC
jgi:hypothetical protein